MDEVVNKIISRIEFITYKNCIGCAESCESFKDHTCYIYDWNWKVALYFNQAIEELGLKTENLESLKLNVDDSNGSSYDC